MKLKYILCLTILLSAQSFAQDDAMPDTTINGMDFGPLAHLIGIWKSVESGGIDVAPGQEGSTVGKGNLAVESFYEVITFEPAADVTNAGDQYLVAMYYKQEVFRKKDNEKFHDQRGYFMYDKKNQIVYNSFCIPRGVCVVAEGEAGDKMTLTSAPQGIAESSSMTEHANTTKFTMNLDLSSKDTLSYSQITELNIYGKLFVHTDSSKLYKVVNPK